MRQNKDCRKFGPVENLGQAECASCSGTEAERRERVFLKRGAS